MELGKSIKARRELYELPQKELARRAKTSPAMICYIETGRKNPSFELLLKIASALHCTVSELVGDQSA